MKKILFLLLTITLSSGFIGCSKDDDGLSKTEYADKMSKYTQLQIDINNQKAKIARLQEESKDLKGGRWQIAQEEINREMVKLSNMQQELSKLKRELGIK